jgi:hypothetical protein
MLNIHQQPFQHFSITPLNAEIKLRLHADSLRKISCPRRARKKDAKANAAGAS